MNSQQYSWRQATAVASFLMFAPLAGAAFAQSPAPDASQPVAAQPAPAPATQAPTSTTSAPQSAPQDAAAPSPGPAQTATPALPAAGQNPALATADVQGLDVFGSEGQQIGKVVAVNQADGVVKSLDVQSNGFFGFFKKTYEIPFSAVKKNGAKVELSMTSQEVAGKLKK